MIQTHVLRLSLHREFPFSGLCVNKSLVIFQNLITSFRLSCKLQFFNYFLSMHFTFENPISSVLALHIFFFIFILRPQEKLCVTLLHFTSGRFSHLVIRFKIICFTCPNLLIIFRCFVLFSASLLSDHLHASLLHSKLCTSISTYLLFSFTQTPSTPNFFKTELNPISQAFAPYISVNKVSYTVFLFY